MIHTVNSFAKGERLCSQRQIELLFQHGERMMAFPFSIHFLINPSKDNEPSPAQVLISTSKRRFHHAVDRNRIKRLTRECYRTRKYRLYEQLNLSGLTMTFSLQYISNEIMDFATLGRKMDKVIASLSDKVRTAVPPTSEQV